MDLLLKKKNISLELSLEYEVHIFIQIYYYFNEIFQPIINLNKFDKLGIINYNNNINNDIYYVNIYLIDFRFCIYKNKIIQPLLRWYYKENRLNVFTKLDIIFSEYYNILNKLKILKNKYNDTFKLITYKFQNLNNILLNKIDILVYSYHNDNFIMMCINRYIQYLNIYNL
jgi:hypothetical protein